MDPKIKQYADSGDLTQLKYIFVDALDVDPTFERYEEAYNYCKSIPGLLEEHMELTPFSDNPAQWTELYWAHLKLDLKKNFSDWRMNHMRAVAQVFLADKVARIRAERQAAALAPAEPILATPPAKLATPVPSAAPVSAPRSASSRAEQQERELAEARAQAAAEYKQAEQQAAAKQRAREEAAQSEADRRRRTDGDLPKKAVGIALVVAVLVLIAVALFLLRK